MMSSEIEELRRRVAEQRAVSPADVIIAHEPIRPSWVPPGGQCDFNGIWRDAGGRIVRSPGAASYEEYQETLRRAAALREAEAEEYRSHDNDGNKLPEGLFRDPCGTIRYRSDGRTYASVKNEIRELEEQWVSEDAND